MKDNQLVWYYNNTVMVVINKMWNGLDSVWFVELAMDENKTAMIEILSKKDESMTFGYMKEKYPEYLI